MPADDGTKWDFDKPEVRKKALYMVRQHRPWMIIGSPENTAFVSLLAPRHRNSDPFERRERWIKALVHLEFTCMLYAEQAAGGRFFVHEYPASAAAWKQPCMQRTANMTGVVRVNGTMNMLVRRKRDGNAVRRRIGFMTNSATIARRISRECEGDKRTTGNRETLQEGICAGLLEEIIEYNKGKNDDDGATRRRREEIIKGTKEAQKARGRSSRQVSVLSLSDLMHEDNDVGDALPRDLTLHMVNKVSRKSPGGRA